MKKFKNKSPTTQFVSLKFNPFLTPNFSNRSTKLLIYLLQALSLFQVYANRRVVSPDETPTGDEPVTTTVRRAKLLPDSGSSPPNSLPGRQLMLNRFLNSPPSPIKPVSPGGGGMTSSSASPATPLDADEGGSLPAISSSSSDEGEDNKQVESKVRSFDCLLK